MVRMTNVLDCIFPGFKPFFKNKFPVAALHILADYPSPDKIAGMSSRSYDNLRRVSRGKFSMDKFVLIKRLAGNTVGESNHIMRFELETLLDLCSQLDSKIDKTEGQTVELIKNIAPPLLYVKGAGEITAAVIYAEYGNIESK